MSSEPSPTANEPNEPESIAPEEWVDRYGDHLYRFARVRLRNASEAEEAVQETFLSAIAGQDQYSGSGSQRNWLISILRRKIVDAMRRRAKLKRVAANQVGLDSAVLFFDHEGRWKPGSLPYVTPESGLEARELWQVVHECLKQLVPSQADVFVLSVIEEMSAERICEELDISLSNMWVRLHRARLGLAKCVASKWLETDSEEAAS